MFTSRGRYEYTGTADATCSGLACKAWSTAMADTMYTDYHDNHTDADFPVDGSIVDSSSYCRNPDLRSAGDWCAAWSTTASAAEVYYTQEACCLPNCEGRG